MSSDLIVALDVPGFKEARRLVDKLAAQVRIFKVGSQLFTACGLEIVNYIRAKGAEVFLDLKFHDIPNTVACAVEAAVSLKVFMLTVHAQGGKEMLRAAKIAAQKTARQKGLRRPLIVAVTVLTSQSFNDVRRKVLGYAKLSQECGLDGVVVSVKECALIRKRCGKDFVIVTPGVRPLGSDLCDQKRVATPLEAKEAGSSFVVMGRPIIKARNILKTLQGVLTDLR
jgi:orotidine-5'-phosphate decarboxylase